MAFYFLVLLLLSGAVGKVGGPDTGDDIKGSHAQQSPVHGGKDASAGIIPP